MNTTADRTLERHPLSPFLPEGCRLLMLGSFPPERKRWSMEFFYPNFNNDMWRIMGLIFHNDKKYFERHDARRFDRDLVAAFCTDHGIGLYDTASEVCRTAGNASDKYLDVVTPTDIASLLWQIPQCQAIVLTGEKAAETLAQQIDCAKPSVGGYVTVSVADRTIDIYRMPSSSRAYPLALEKKADPYRLMFRRTGVLL